MHPAHRVKFPIFVSQDRNAPSVQDTVYSNLSRVKYLQHEELADPILDSPTEKMVYYKIAQHYKFVLRTMFDCFNYPRVILLEVMRCFAQRATSAMCSACH